MVKNKIDNMRLTKSKKSINQSLPKKYFYDVIKTKRNTNLLAKLAGLNLPSNFFIFPKNIYYGFK